MKKLSLLSALLSMVLMVQAQKVKYKDIFPDLEARKFNKVEPMLKSFLTNEKNADHPNANYQMGLITEAHFLLQDIVEDTTALFKHGEDALNYYRKSLTLITDKEIKKNDNFYQSFNRRDLRTGDFGIKLSDVHLEIEEKIASVENRIAAVRSFHQAVDEMTTMEAKLLADFNGFVASADSYYDYLLKADLDVISALGDLQADFKAFDDKANETVNYGKTLGAENYYNTIKYLPITDFGKLGAKFPESNTTISTWQFSSWASDTKGILNKEIFVLKNDLSTLDKKLLQATNRLKAGSAVSFQQSIPMQLDKRLKKYDWNPLPGKLLRARINENTIRLLGDTTMNAMLLDSTVVSYQVTMADSIVNAMEALKTLLTVDSKEIAVASIYYPDYLEEGYGSVDGLRTYMEEIQAWIARIQPYWQKNKDFWYMRDNWGVTATDTIPLHQVDTAYQGPYVTKGYLNLPENEVMSWGFKRDSLIGFVARFGADRKLIWEKRFKTDLLYVDVDYGFETDTLSSDADQVAFYLYKELVPTESNINVVNVNLDGELNWSVNTQTSREPEYTTYSHEIQETTIFLYPQEQYPLTNGELGYLIITRDGEVR